MKYSLGYPDPAQSVCDDLQLAGYNKPWFYRMTMFLCSKHKNRNMREQYINDIEI